MKLVIVSENTLLILSEQGVSDEDMMRIRQLTQLLQREIGHLIIDMIPAYASIHITFNMLAISADMFKQKIQSLMTNTAIMPSALSSKKIIEIPTYYGKEVALDLALLAERTQLPMEDIVSIHSSHIYDVCAIGFAPGFAYLGHVDSRIASPRKSTPRKNVAQGSVGIADQQTAVYPSDSPGGWQIIGRTPLALVDYHCEPFSIFSVGDRVQFTSITKTEYCALGGALP
jgi:KipI family sensor histidine kinase inhibitor